MENINQMSLVVYDNDSSSLLSVAGVAGHHYTIILSTTLAVLSLPLIMDIFNHPH